MAATNPYATPSGDYVSFPSDFPPGLINTYMQALASSQRPQADLLEILLKGAIGAGTGFLQEMGAERATTFKTNEAVRQRQAEIDALLQDYYSREAFKKSSEAEDQLALGQASGMLANILTTPGEGTTHTYQTGQSAPPPPEESPDYWSTKEMTQPGTLPVDQDIREDVIDTPGEVGGALTTPNESDLRLKLDLLRRAERPVGVSNITEYTPGERPTGIEAWAKLAASDSRLAGVLAKFLGPAGVRNFQDPAAAENVDAKRLALLAKAGLDTSTGRARELTAQTGATVGAARSRNLDALSSLAAQRAAQLAERIKREGLTTASYQELQTLLPSLDETNPSLAMQIRQGLAGLRVAPETMQSKSEGLGRAGIDLQHQKPFYQGDPLEQLRMQIEGRTRTSDQRWSNQRIGAEYAYYKMLAEGQSLQKNPDRWRDLTVETVLRLSDPIEFVRTLEALAELKKRFGPIPGAPGALDDATGLPRQPR